MILNILNMKISKTHENKTNSIKLFGEEILGGKVSFRKSLEEGTIFRFSH